MKKRELLVEKDGIVIMKITDPIEHDMFWRSYAVEYVETDQDLQMKEVGFWDDVKFFDITLNEYMEYAIVALTPFYDGRLVVRGEYIPKHLDYVP